MAKDIHHQHPLYELHLLDPKLARRMIRVCDQLHPAPLPDMLRRLVDEIKWGLNQEISFGLVLAEGYLTLLHRNDPGLLKKYGRLVRNAGKKGPTIGRLMARYLVAVLDRKDDVLLRTFLKTIETMTAKGTYTLKTPLAVLEHMLNGDEVLAALAYLDLLQTVFAQDLNYNQSQHLSLRLPKAVLKFPSAKRVWQLRLLDRIIHSDMGLVDAFLDGLEKGLQLLGQEALTQFVAIGLNQARQNPKAGHSFFNLDSGRGLEVFSTLQKAASLQQVQSHLNRYLRARTGRPMAVRPLSQLPRQFVEASQASVRVCSDGKFIYLPEEIERFDSRSDNERLYRCLVRFESGHAEFGTYDFDLQKLLDRRRHNPHGPLPFWPNFEADPPRPTVQSDLERFFCAFPNPGLASDLFTVFEHGRIHRHLAQRYPGMIREHLPMLQHEADLMFTADQAAHPLALLYAEIALASAVLENAFLDFETKACLGELVERFNNANQGHTAPVEVSGELTVASYRVVENLLREKNLINDTYQPIGLPFGRTLNPAMAPMVCSTFERTARIIVEKLAQKGYHVFRSDLRKHLEDTQGILTPEDLSRLIAMSAHDGSSGNDRTQVSLNDIELPEIFEGTDIQTINAEATGAKISWYPEWDVRLGDYLNNYVRVVDRALDGGQSEFYARTLDRYRGMVKQLRYAFELIRPEGLKLYRRWIEGDAFDYRALLDFAIDRKAGRTPSERLYIKRVKEIRDVAALLLVDLSRSTAHPVSGSSASVLDVEKEAIVLFSEALEVLGDAYAIAGFSGTGRLGVDYFHLKDFEELMNAQVRNRINALTPQRNTRMGAAIRHAASQFEQSQARVRLLILLGDGFPNDLTYKKAYAVEDTRKAIAELRARHIHVHAITVNIQTSGSSKLDQIYGDIHHTVIADVCELPDKLLRIYGKLTQR